MNPHAVARVKIVRAPQGEAPDWVREAWVGLVLPLKESRLTIVTPAGVLSGPRSPMGLFWASLTGGAGQRHGLSDAGGAGHRDP